jgi:hypothetical protein
MKKHWVMSAIVFAFLFEAVGGIAIGQSKSFDIEQARNAFKTVAGEHFELLGDELAGLESEKRPGAYWLVKVKPKKPGHYAVKYVYKYNDKFYSEGENVIRFGVGGSPCDRHPHPEGGIARFCSNDTVILPVRAANRYEYTFEIKYTFEGDPVYSGPKRPSETADPVVPKIQNPLSSHLKFIGTGVSSRPHRSCCVTTYEYYAIFEAVSPGRFNIGVSLADKDKPHAADMSTSFFGGGMPVVILDPGKPITYLAGYEDTINYSDNKRFSSHSGGTFPTRLLILQPGDRVELRFLTFRDDEKIGGEKKVGGLQTADKLPAVEKYPFYVNPDWSYNAFIAQYFTADKQP